MLSPEDSPWLLHDPRVTNTATVSVIYEARSLEQELEKLHRVLDDLVPPRSESYVQSTLFEVESSIGFNIQVDRKRVY